MSTLQDQPAPIPSEGVDVIEDLVKRIGGDFRDGTHESLVLMLLGIATDVCRIKCGDRVSWVLAELRARRALGIERYGTPLRTHNGRDARVDAAQELFDAAIYLWQAKLEQEASKSGPPQARDGEG